MIALLSFCFDGFLAFSAPPFVVQRRLSKAARWRVCYIQARRAFFRGKLVLAAKKIDCALRFSPRDPEVFLLAGRIYLKLGKLRKAAILLRRGFRLSPRGSSLRYKFLELMLFIALKNSRYEEAEKLFRIALREFPNSPVVVRLRRVKNFKSVVPEVALGTEMTSPSVLEESVSAKTGVEKTTPGESVSHAMVQIPEFIKLRVAVFDFKGSSENQVKAFSGYLCSEFSQSGRYVLVERSRLEEIMKEKKLGLSGLTQGNYSIIGEFEGVDCAIVGEISSDKDSSGHVRYVVTGRLVDVATSKVLLSSAVEGRDLKEIAASLAGRLLLPSFYGPVKGVLGEALIFEIRKGAKPVPGQKVALLKISSEVRDETTGELLGVEWEKVGYGQVQEITSESPSGAASVKVIFDSALPEDTREQVKKNIEKIFVFSR